MSASREMPELPPGWRWEHRPHRWVAVHPHGWGYGAPDRDRTFSSVGGERVAMA